MSPARPALAALLCLFVAACGSANVKPPQPPDTAVLSEAEAMVSKARDAGAEQLAPDALLSARRRLATARDLLYGAAGRDPGQARAQRVQRLADAAYLDARLALVQTQVAAIRRKNDEFTAELQGGSGAKAGEGER